MDFMLNHLFPISTNTQSELRKSNRGRISSGQKKKEKSNDSPKNMIIMAVWAEYGPEPILCTQQFTESAVGDTANGYYTL